MSSKRKTSLLADATDQRTRRWQNLVRRSIAPLVLCVAPLALASFTASPADAYAFNGCRWNHRSIRFYVPSPLLSYPAWTSGANTWSGLHAKYVLTGNNPDVRGTNENRGNTVVWNGVTRRSGTVQDPPSCPKGFFVSGRVEVVINWPRVSNYSRSKQRMVAAHELGHVFGLAHTPAHPEWLMYPSDQRTVLVPQHNDKAGVNARYP